MGGRLADWINAVNDKGTRLDPFGLKMENGKKKNTFERNKIVFFSS